MTDPISTVSILNFRPNDGEMLKPAELIEIDGAEKLTLNARRIYNILLHNAHGPELGQPYHQFRIAFSDLKFAHAGNDRLVPAVKSLMKTIVTVRLEDGRTAFVPLLGKTSVTSLARERGVLTYQFDPDLIMLLRDSRIFAKLQLDVIHAVSSKYALALYEIVAKRVRLSFVKSEVFGLDDFRVLLGVEPGKLATYSNLLKFAIKPAFDEVNRLAEFSVAFEPVKVGRKVEAIRIAWAPKGVEARKAAYAAIRGNTEVIDD